MSTPKIPASCDGGGEFSASYGGGSEIPAFCGMVAIPAFCCRCKGLASGWAKAQN